MLLHWLTNEAPLVFVIPPSLCCLYACHWQHRAACLNQRRDAALLSVVQMTEESRKREINKQRASNSSEAGLNRSSHIGLWMFNKNDSSLLVYFLESLEWGLSLECQSNNEYQKIFHNKVVLQYEPALQGNYSWCMLVLLSDSLLQLEVISRVSLWIFMLR